ncbi:unnamed protein product [Caenorhabditis angaria]|uniref:PID domain-containing protein n=1 Tax=Caenorhabditis angaria TaxID=860376 RepID=A0A9P1MZ55_9PELO|nr:unnamed protein product [Caenorhabditis angaria]
MSAFIPKIQTEEEYDESESEEEPTVIKRSFSADWTRNEEESENGSEEEDSDAEFLVHPCLRSLIKSKSAYAVPKNHGDHLNSLEPPKIRPSKTSFEISLNKMIESTTKSIAEETECSVADLLPSFDQKWPDPEETVRVPKKKILRYSPSLSSNNSELEISSMGSEVRDLDVNGRKYRVDGCWSAPPYFLLDSDDLFRGYCTPNQKCWSAPELTEEDIRCHHPCLPIPRIRELASGYPAIETPDNDPSVCSYRLPSSIGSADSPSPPRPLSPVFGKPAPFRIHQSISMQIPPRPDIAAFLADADNEVQPYLIDESSSDESEGVCITEEVWPETADRVVRAGWVEPPVRRSATFQIGYSDRIREGINPSPSAHTGLDLYSLGGESETEEDREGNQEDQGEDQGGLRISVERMTGSEHSQLDETERKALETRQAWMERGSLACLDNPVQNRIHPDLLTSHSNGIQSQYGSYSSLAQAEASTSMMLMKRSCTTDEFRKTRRKLPRRPDELAYSVEIPQSKSMYDRYYIEENGGNSGNIDIEMGGRKSQQYQRPPNLALQSTIDTIIESNRSTMDSSPSLTSHHQKIRQQQQQFAHLETPISPHAVLTSPSPSGRRLPPLPIQSLQLLRRLPANMSIPQNSQSSNKDHQLCFMDGMADSMMGGIGGGAGMDDSYYEEDGLNGNNNQRRRKNMGRKSFFSPDDSSGVSSCTTSDSQNPTHRVQSAFHPRHSDELLLEIGDAVHVDRTADDHWSYGTNLRTGQSGIFPASIVCEIDLVEEICLGALPSNTTKIMNDDRDTFYLTMLASIEVAHHKGNDILTQAMNKVLSMYKNSEEIIVPQTVLMEISFRGIHVIDKRRKNFFQCPMFDFFYSLQNISFCGAHPKQLKYFGFITKHPLLPRFACHVFMSNSSTQPIVEAIGRAFKRSYDEYMAFAHPTEDIYLE